MSDTSTTLTGADATQTGTQNAGQPANADGVKPTDAADAAGGSAAPKEGATGEGQASDGKDGAGESKSGESKEVVYDLKAPEGVQVDGKTLESFVGLAKELEISPEHAQRLIEFQAAQVKAQQAELAKTQAAWETALREDKDFGGDKYDANVAVAKKALSLGPPELVELLNTTKLGSHPAVVRWAYNIGKKMSEGSFVPASGSLEANRTAASVLYPSDK